MVAKTFQTMTQLCEPYLVGNKMYVKVKNEKTGTIRQVRWYTEAEYAKLYPEATPAEANPSIFAGKQKEMLGFQKGYITIFKGDTEGADFWFQKSIARYTRFWGWYIVSTDEVPNDLPAGIEPVRLSWELVGQPNGDLKSETEVTAAVESLLCEDSPSRFVGAVGERLNLTVTVIKSMAIDSKYGSTTIHIMEDADKNIFVWTTAAKSWPAGSVKTIRGTVKEHNIYRNVQQTILTRCAEVK